MDQVEIAAIAVLVTVGIAVYDHIAQRRLMRQQKLEQLYDLLGEWRAQMIRILILHESDPDSDIDEPTAKAIEAKTKIETLVEIYFHNNLAPILDILSAAEDTLSTAFSGKLPHDSAIQSVREAATASRKLIKDKKRLVL